MYAEREMLAKAIYDFEKGRLMWGWYICAGRFKEKEKEKKGKLKKKFRGVRKGCS